MVQFEYEKDNLTDVVQAIPKTPVNTQVTPQQLVTTNEGDIVTLGKKQSYCIYENCIELYVLVLNVLFH